VLRDRYAATSSARIHGADMLIAAGMSAIGGEADIALTSRHVCSWQQA